MIQDLLAMHGEVEPEEVSLRNWRNMSVEDRTKTEMMWKAFASRGMESQNVQ